MSTDTAITHEYLMAGDIRPDHVVSLSGYEKDAAVVVNVQPSADYYNVLITLETGHRKSFPIDFPLVVFSE